MGVQVSPACAIIARNRSQASPSAMLPLPVPGTGALLIAPFINGGEGRVGNTVGIVKSKSVITAVSPTLFAPPAFTPHPPLHPTRPRSRFARATVPAGVL